MIWSVMESRGGVVSGWHAGPPVQWLYSPALLYSCTDHLSVYSSVTQSVSEWWVCINITSYCQSVSVCTSRLSHNSHTNKHCGCKLTKTWNQVLLSVRDPMVPRLNGSVIKNNRNIWTFNQRKKHIKNLW